MLAQWPPDAEVRVTVIDEGTNTSVIEPVHGVWWVNSSEKHLSIDGFRRHGGKPDQS